MKELHNLIDWDQLEFAEPEGGKLEGCDPSDPGTRGDEYEGLNEILSSWGILVLRMTGMIIN